MCGMEAMALEKVLDDVREFADRAKALFPEAEIWLYGSYAKGCADAGSDIDVAVILPDGVYDPDTYLDIQGRLFRTSFEIQPIMEPCLFIEGTDLLGFVERAVRGPGIRVA